ncbi:MAG: DUF3089 domain-containing protein [Lentisphaeria bacterium]|nr:DUF3089 domain-containing protein [Lentisphaeria bacterium]
MVFGLSGCVGTSTVASKGNTTDYFQKASWLQLPEITKDVDTFYIYSTAYYESSFKEGASDHATLDNPEMIEGAKGEYVTNASVYEKSTNVFVPYYRQAGMRYAGEIRKKTGSIDAAISGIPYDDITAALDYYFEHCNQGRPFIIAGHSQGAAMVKYVLKHYFKKHPDYYKRMVAAYVIGFSVTKDDLEKYPHLKFATGESDTGVIISWNTEGPKNVKGNAKNAVVLPNAISINPLNWKRDETYAPASENLGSLMPNEKTRRYVITNIGADAQVVLARGVIVTNAKWDHPADPAFFGPQSFHEDDYTFYYNNLEDNVAMRIAAYKARIGAAPDYSRKSCWYKIPNITKDVDTFFVYPTEYLGTNQGDPDYAPLDNPEMLEGVKNVDHKYMASVYEGSTNLFIPYYRQAGFRFEADAWKKTGDIRTALTGIPYDDITAALDYYFENYNNGRPFILAGHSQGSAICTLVLQKYFRKHPEYYKRMVAAYIIGFSVTKDELKANPHLKFATGERDTGVIVSWNTEGPKNVEKNVPNVATLPNAVSINPLNWKLDATYAPASKNLGSLVPDEKTGKTRIGDLGADAQVAPGRGVIVTNAKFEPMEMTELFGPQSFHNGDYLFYYNNIKDNVAKRIAAYLSRKK